MAIHSQKLKDVFKQKADKLVAMDEISSLRVHEHAQFSSDEAGQLSAAYSDPSRAYKTFSATAGVLLSNVLVNSAGRQFMTVEGYRQMDDAIRQVAPLNLPEDLLKKVEDAMATALTKATDYGSQKAALGLKPMGR